MHSLRLGSLSSRFYQFWSIRKLRTNRSAIFASLRGSVLCKFTGKSALSLDRFTVWKLQRRTLKSAFSASEFDPDAIVNFYLKCLGFQFENFQNKAFQSIVLAKITMRSPLKVDPLRDVRKRVRLIQSKTSCQIARYKICMDQKGIVLLSILSLLLKRRFPEETSGQLRQLLNVNTNAFCFLQRFWNFSRALRHC